MRIFFITTFLVLAYDYNNQNCKKDVRVEFLTLSMEANCVSDSSVMKFPSTMNPEEVIWLVSVLERQHMNQRRKANIVRVKGGGI